MDPADPALQELATDAYQRWRNERWERFIDDIDVGELHSDLSAGQSDIDAGKWGADQLFQLGDEIFEREFRAVNGFGRGQADQGIGRHIYTRIRRVHDGTLGGPDTASCTDCHHRGGVDGAGDVTQNALLFGDGSRTSSAVERNPPPVTGLGVIELLAHEMTQELHTTVTFAKNNAIAGGQPIEVKLLAKGVYFGTVTVDRDGSFDPADLEGIDEDLVVKPFGWKGEHASLRSFAEEALQRHLNLLTSEIVARHEHDPAPDVLGDGPAWDPDRDGTPVDFSAGQLTALQLYLSLLEIPIVRPPQSQMGQEMYQAGAALFSEIGCASCHVPQMELESDVYRVRPIVEGAPEIELRLSQHMDAPTIRRDEPYARGYVVRAFSDFKRHDMGAGLAERKQVSAVPAATFRTPPLWGLADSAPYLHDGRALTVDEAIGMHGGEASDASAAFASLDAHDKAAVRVFLLSLTRAKKVVYR